MIPAPIGISVKIKKNVESPCSSNIGSIKLAVHPPITPAKKLEINQIPNIRPTNLTGANLLT